jgi:predicted MFS family arabinose efflux permease
MSGTRSIAARAQAGPADRGHQHSLSLALLVIATAQLMVVLDSTIVNVALPPILRALGFSGSGLEWLLAARALQGIGAAVVAPTALSLVTTTFPEGAQRNRAMGVYAAMSIGGAAMGLLAGGLLTTYASWRWVLFVNVPIGVAVALLAPRALPEVPGRPGRFDVTGAITVTLGLACLVYGLSSAAMTTDGVSHWGDAKVVGSLTAAVILLGAFAVIEARSRLALVPLRIFRNLGRSGAYLVMLCLGTAMFGLFFFLTLFMEDIWGYSALRTGVAYLPMVTMIMAMALTSSQLVARIGVRPVVLPAAAISAGGMFWLSQITEHSSYAGGLLGPTLLTGAGLGLLFTPLTLTALSKVDNADAGLASSLINTGQVVGGSIGLAILGTVAWTVVVNTARNAAHAAGSAAHAAGSAQVRISGHALAAGFSRGFEVSAAIMVLALVVGAIMIRVSRQDLTGAQP